MKITEKQFLNTVRETALRAGWKFYHTFDSRRSDPGFPDIVMVKNGHLWFVELKTDRGKLTEGQKHWIKELDYVSAGPKFRVFVLRPKEFNDFWKYMRKI